MTSLKVVGSFCGGIRSRIRPLVLCHVAPLGAPTSPAAIRVFVVPDVLIRTPIVVPASPVFSGLAFGPDSSAPPLPVSNSATSKDNGSVDLLIWKVRVKTTCPCRDSSPGISSTEQSPTVYERTALLPCKNRPRYFPHLRGSGPWWPGRGSLKSIPLAQPGPGFVPK